MRNSVFSAQRRHVSFVRSSVPPSSRAPCILMRDLSDVFHPTAEATSTGMDRKQGPPSIYGSTVLSMMCPCLTDMKYCRPPITSIGTKKRSFIHWLCSSAVSPLRGGMTLSNVYSSSYIHRRNWSPRHIHALTVRFPQKSMTLKRTTSCLAPFRASSPTYRFE